MISRILAFLFLLKLKFSRNKRQFTTYILIYLFQVILRVCVWLISNVSWCLGDDLITDLHQSDKRNRVCERRPMKHSLSTTMQARFTAQKIPTTGVCAMTKKWSNMLYIIKIFIVIPFEAKETSCTSEKNNLDEFQRSSRHSSISFGSFQAAFTGIYFGTP